VPVPTGATTGPVVVTVGGGQASPVCRSRHGVGDGRVGGVRRGGAEGGASVANGSTLSWSHRVTTSGSNLLLTAGVAVGKSGDAGLSLAATYNGCR
jgi:hypothetical protein